MKEFYIVSIFNFILNLAASNEEFCSSLKPEGNGLVTPLLEEIKNLNIQRYKDFDDEDMDTYIEVMYFVSKIVLTYCEKNCSCD
jgi:hypothetical protein